MKIKFSFKKNCMDYGKKRQLHFGGAYAPPQDKNFSLSLRTIGLVKQNSYSPSGQQGLRPQEKEK